MIYRQGEQASQPANKAHQRHQSWKSAAVPSKPCKKELSKAAVGQFGSGWAWLVQDGEKLAILKTPDAHTPVSGGPKALLTIDVWEHAYYLDYQNRRVDYVNALIEKLANWGFAADNLGRSAG